MDPLRQHIEEISSLTDAEFDHVRPFFTLRKVRKHQYLVNEGDEAKYEYLVLSGIYKVFYVDEQGKEYIVQFAKAGWWMSDYEAFFKQGKASMFIECLVPGEVFYSTLEAREQLSKSLHQMEHFFRVKLTNGYVAQQQRIKLLLSSTPQQRYEAFARLYPDLLQQVPKKHCRIPRCQPRNPQPPLCRLKTCDPNHTIIVTCFLTLPCFFGANLYCNHSPKNLQS